jgi:AraC family transcriptional regulator, positive regulator of tynA and feaB
MSTPALHRWSTDAAAPAARLDYWIGAVCEGFLEMDVTSPQPQAFAAELTSAPLGALQLNRVRGSAQDVYRTRRAVARSRDQFFYLLCKTDSAWVTAQHGRQARLLPGDLVLVDSRACYEFHFGESCDTVSIELPTAWVERWLPDPAAQVARRIDGSTGFGAALSAFARTLQPELALAPPLPAELLTDQLGALLALATGGRAADSAGAPDLRRRIADALRERHAEPGLTAAQVAAHLGIGERSLHRALAGGDQTFATLLAQCRIDSARRLLADPRFDRLTLAEIGRRVGLLDASHFVRVFRRHTGGTPGALRRRP